MMWGMKKLLISLSILVAGTTAGALEGGATGRIFTVVAGVAIWITLRPLWRNK